MVRAARELTDLPFEAHLMVNEPEPILERFARAGVQLITIHPEACSNPSRVIGQIKALGLRAGIALSPDVPVSVLEPIQSLIDIVLVMVIKPGWGNQAYLPHLVPKIAQVREQLGSNAGNTLIAVDGRVGLSNAPDMVRRGARLLICGTSSIFLPGVDVRDSFTRFRKELEATVFDAPKRTKKPEDRKPGRKG
jgi:ribulose-phosphate 3-epimerase